VFVQFLDQNLWMIFILGIPGELIVIFWSRLTATPKKKL